MKRLRHPFWGSVAVIVGAYLLFRWGIRYLPPVFGADSAPVPSSVVLQYVVTVAVAVLLYVSAEEERWERFKAPLLDLFGSPERSRARAATIGLLTLAAGYLAYASVKPSYAAPASLRSIHPAPPNQIDFRGETMRLAGLENPLREEGSMEEHVARGAAVYARNCVPCHGDRLDGHGHFADALSPVPADFTSSGTIAQLTESYVFWRIAEGGPGLPAEGTPWNSAMPVWEDVLTADEIWSVILYLYDQTGWTPRTWEEQTTDEGGGQ